MSFQLDDAIAVMEKTPATVRALLHGVPESGTTCNEGPDTFSAFDNVGHLIHGERTDWIARPRIILAQIARVMAKRYREDVGPWREYLPILDRP